VTLDLRRKLKQLNFKLNHVRGRSLAQLSLQFKTSFTSHPDCIVGIETCYGLDGLGFKPHWGRDLLHHPQWPWGPHSLLCSGYQVFTRGKAARSWHWPSTPIQQQLKKKKGRAKSLLPSVLHGMLWTTLPFHTRQHQYTNFKSHCYKLSAYITCIPLFKSISCWKLPAL